MSKMRPQVFQKQNKIQKEEKTLPFQIEFISAWMRTAFLAFSAPFFSAASSFTLPFFPKL